MKSQLPRFRLGTLLVCVTLLCLWLGYQMRWVHQRREALTWIRKHSTEFSWFSVDPAEVAETPRWGAPTPYKQRSAPLLVWLIAEPQVHFMVLDKAKLSSEDGDTLKRLETLFPEADGIHIEEPGWSHRWTLETHAEIFEWESDSPSP